MAETSSVLFLQQFDKTVGFTSPSTIYMMVPLFMFLFLVFNILVALIYPNKRRYPLTTDLSNSNGINPFTDKLTSGKAYITASLFVLVTFLYCPFFYGLAKPLKTSLYDTFVYSANFFMVQIILSLIFTVLGITTRYSINTKGFCPRDAEPVVGTTTGEITCSRKPWEAAWAIISQTISDFLSVTIVTPYMSVLGGLGNSSNTGNFPLVTFQVLVFVITIYAGYIS